MISNERKQLLGHHMIQLLESMHSACNVLLEEAGDRNMIYPVHGAQVADPPGVVGDAWKVRRECFDGYARNFEEQRQTLDFIGNQVAKEDRESVAAERLDFDG